MRVLALDLGSHTGWAIGVDGRHIASGTWDLAPARQRRFEGGGMRWLRLEQMLNELPGAIDHVVVEEVRRHAGVDAAHVYGGALATVTKWCEACGIPYSAEPVGTIKKFATGKGNADKPAMIATAMERWGIECCDDNQADAVALLHLAMSESRVTP